ncbi:MAG: thymidine phosphorylase [Myxococcales bacterium]|nr:thymidine phosphorylase [Myxococcales bacterium]
MSAPNVQDVLEAMAAGRALTDQQVAAFVDGVVDGSVSRPQVAAWLAFAHARGLSASETVALTRCMTNSGDVLRWPEGPQLVDKHSTGGVGDKISLVLAPLWAELGYRVPMLSGRGLAHTGGTLDKLESIAGYRTDLEPDALATVLEDVGCFITGQTAQLAPADRVLYALRDETRTIASIPLIVGSILSKKLAAGVQRLVLDVKTGSGAFMKELDQARALARALVRAATDSGMSCTALVTRMDRPLGRAVGNRLEVAEAVATLKGAGPDDVRELTVQLASVEGAAQVLASGRAYERFARMVAAQGGQTGSLDRMAATPAGIQIAEVTAEASGIVQQVDALTMGMAAFALGAGRRRAEEAVDPDVGLVVDVQPGQTVQSGDVLVRVHHRGGRGLEEATRRIQSGILMDDADCAPIPLVHEAVHG